MFISTLNPNIALYFGTTKVGTITLQIVPYKNFKDSIKTFLNAEESEKVIAIIDNFLNGKPIQNPIQINSNQQNIISMFSQDNKLSIIVSNQTGNTTILLSKLQATALRRYLSYWPIYSALMDMRRTESYQQGKNQGYQKNNYQQPQQNYQQPQPNYQQPTYQQPSSTQQQVNINPQPTNPVPEQPQAQDVAPAPQPTNVKTDQILNELDDIIGDIT